MREFGCSVHGRLAFGETGGLLYSAELLESAGTVLAFRFLANGNTRPAVKYLKGQRLEHTRWIAAPADEDKWVLAGLLSPPSEFYLRAGISSLLTQAAAAIPAAGLACPRVCPLCGTENCDGAAFIASEWRAVHLSCLDVRLHMPAEDYTPPDKPHGFFSTGAAGALVGAFIGALPIWALALSSKQTNWALYAFIPFLSALCYRLCRGRAGGPFAAVCVGAASLIMTLGLEQLGYQIALSEAFARNVPFSVSVPLYFSSFAFFTVIRQMLFRLLALLMGFVAAGLFLRRYAAGLCRRPTVHGSDFVRRTAVPRT